MEWCILVQLTIPDFLKHIVEESEEARDILGELPPQVTKEVINQVSRSAESATKISSSIIAYREKIRKILSRQRLLNKYERVYSIDPYNILAVDGTYKVITTTMYDIIFVGAVAYSFRKDGFKHEMHAIITPPSILSEKIARGLMVFLEFKLASEMLSNYEFIILDGSYIANLTNISELTVARKQNPDDPIWDSEDLMRILKHLSGRRIISKLLKVPRAVASPKKQTGKILIRRYLNDLGMNATDAAVLSLILEPGEWVKISWTGREFLLATKFYNTEITPIDSDFIESFLNTHGLDIVYFKPKEWSRSYKIEYPGRLRNNQLQRVLDLISSQVNNPLIEELELQYLAHLICSQLTKVAMILFASTKNVLQQRFARKWMNMIFAATRYRTVY